jgi:hypothetical protein
VDWGGGHAPLALGFQRWEGDQPGGSQDGLGRFFLVEDYVQERAGGMTYRAHGVFGWDAPSGRYMMHWFDSMGMDPGVPAPGTWEGDTLRFQHQKHMGHIRYTYRFLDPQHYTFRLDMSRDGKEWAPFIDGTFTRTRS